MADKEKILAKEEPIFKVGDTIQKKDNNSVRYSIINKTSDGYHALRGLSDTIVIWFSEQDQWELVEESVSELLNTESMIESYKQRLISQANGVKNSPLIDMCIASYKHGINETLDTLNLSNAERIGKEWKEWLVSEDLEKAANKYIKGNYSPWLYKAMFDCFKAGAKWKESHLWKSADGDDLPEIDMEVVVLTQKYPLKGSEYAVSFAHRPYKGKYIGKSLTTGNIETFENKTYDKGGWNQPNVKWWLDCDWPKQKEK